MRIVSLIASSTEIVCALGLEKNLVGRSHECDFPPSVESLPACSEPKIQINASSKDIDRQVKDIVRDSLSVYSVHKDVLKELKPDLIVTQDQCDVCAVSLKDVEQAVSDWVESKPQIVSLKADDLEGIFKSIEIVGQAAGVLDKSKEVVKRLNERMRTIEQQVPNTKNQIKIACIEWIEPLMAAGNWVPELVERLRANNLFGEAGKHSPWMTWEELKQSNPDVIMIMPCGWDIKRTQEEMFILEAQEGWEDLGAVKNGQVYLTDGNQYFNRPGPRIVESMEIMAEILYPNQFNFGHKSAGWIKFNDSQRAV